MRAMMLVVFAVLAVLGACASNPASSESDLQTIRNAIDSLDQRVQRWIAEEKTDSIVNGYYTTDAIVMNPNQPAAVGNEAIRSSFNGFFKQSAVRIRFKMASIIVSDSVVSDQGHYTLEIRAKPDTTKVLMSDHGSYVTTFVKRNGQWRALFDIATSDVPASPPPAAPTAAKKR